MTGLPPEGEGEPGGAGGMDPDMPSDMTISIKLISVSRNSTQVFSQDRQAPKALPGDSDRPERLEVVAALGGGVAIAWFSHPAPEGPGVPQDLRYERIVGLSVLAGLGLTMGVQPNG